MKENREQINSANGENNEVAVYGLRVYGFAGSRRDRPACLP